MPIYEYRCGACGFQKEYLQRMSDAPLTDCPECGKPQFNKMVTAAGFQLKGNGWYVTDFKNKGNGASAKTTKSEDKSVEAKKDEPAKKDASSKSDATCGTGACPACS
jgi:putative FmdB family regulatory protein